MILVTGATGKTGKAVVRALANRDADVRAMVHREEQRGLMIEVGARQAMPADFYHPESLRRAMTGCTAVYHICPNVDPDEVKIGASIIGAARASGVTWLVYHSVLHPQIEEMPHHWLKMRVEDLLFRSGLEYTILQPSAYMQNVLAQWDRMKNEGVYAVPYRAETRLSLVDLEDVAEAAARILTEEGHREAIYELAGPEAPTQQEVASAVGAVLGREIRVEVTALEEWERKAGAMDEYACETLLQMFRYYDCYGLCGNPAVLKMLLKRPPTRLASFLERTHAIRRM